MSTRDTSRFQTGNDRNVSITAPAPTVWRSWLVWLSILGVGSLLLVVLAVVWNERQSSERTRTELNRLRSQGFPVDNQSLSQWFRERTHSEGTHRWGEILALADGSTRGYPNLERLPILGTSELPEQWMEGQEWPEEPFVAEYLEYCRPLIELIDQASHDPTPVWRPIEFQGISTLLSDLQGARNVSRILSLEAEHAVYHRDPERALRAMRLLGATSSAFEWDFCMVGVLVHVALRGIHYDSIQRSLAASLWSQEQLDELVAQLEPEFNIEQRYRNMIAGERCISLSISNADASAYSPRFGEVFHQLYRLPSTQVTLLQTWQEIESVADGHPPIMLDRIREFEDEIATQQQAVPFSPGNWVIGQLLPSLEASFFAIIRAEDGRRLTRTAIGVKQFQLEFGRWPDRLSELEQVGMKADEWTTNFSGRFGYEVLEEGVRLWTYSAGQPVNSIPDNVVADDPETTDRFRAVFIR